MWEEEAGRPLCVCADCGVEQWKLQFVLQVKSGCTAAVWWQWFFCTSFLMFICWSFKMFSALCFSSSCTGCRSVRSGRCHVCTWLIVAALLWWFPVCVQHADSKRCCLCCFLWCTMFHVTGCLLWKPDFWSCYKMSFRSDVSGRLVFIAQTVKLRFVRLTWSDVMRRVSLWGTPDALHKVEVPSLCLQTARTSGGFPLVCEPRVPFALQGGFLLVQPAGGK